MASVHNLIVKRGEAEILKNFSAEFPEHQVTAVSGRSGCGKTTLLSVLLNLLPADSGEIHGFQKPSAVFQEDRLLPYLTAAKNISVAAGCTETAAEKALLQVGFDPEDLKKNAVQLSGGMARRVSIVRALCLRCKGIVSPGTADDRDCAEHFADRRAAHRRKPQRFLNVRSKVLRCHFFRQLAHVGNVRFALF